METATETKTVTGGIENKLRECHLNMSARANLGGRDWEVDLTASSAGTCKSTASESRLQFETRRGCTPRTPGGS